MLSMYSIDSPSQTVTVNCSVCPGDAKPLDSRRAVLAAGPVRRAGCVCLRRNLPEAGAAGWRDGSVALRRIGADFTPKARRHAACDVRSIARTKTLRNDTSAQNACLLTWTLINAEHYQAMQLRNKGLGEIARGVLLSAMLM